MTALRTLDLLVIAIYFTVVAFIGIWFSRRQTSTEAYFVARRSVPHWAMGLSVFATIISSITFIAYPGAAFKGDWNQLVPGFMAVGVLIIGGTSRGFVSSARITTNWKCLASGGLVLGVSVSSLAITPRLIGSRNVYAPSYFRRCGRMRDTSRLNALPETPRRG